MPNARVLIKRKPHPELVPENPGFIFIHNTIHLSGRS